MTEQYYVRAVDEATGECTVEGPLDSAEAAKDRAERWAESYFGGADMTWVKTYRGTPFRVQAGKLLGDGSSTEPLVTVTVEGGGIA